MSGKHYEFTGETKINNQSVTLRRVRATKDLPHHGIKAGDVGGWIERRGNVTGWAWVADEAEVFGNAQVYHDACIAGSAKVFGEARVYSAGRVSGNASVCGNAGIYGEAHVYDDAWVSGRVQVHGRVHICGNARVFGDAWVNGNAHVADSAAVFGNAEVSGNSIIGGDVHISDSAEVDEDALVLEDSHILSAKVLASGAFAATLVRTKDGHRFAVGCWSGTVEDFETMIRSDEWVEATPEQIETRRPELLAFVEMCKARIATW